MVRNMFTNVYKAFNDLVPTYLLCVNYPLFKPVLLNIFQLLKLTK